jgi:hypothetical protein
MDDELLIDKAVEKAEEKHNPGYELSPDYWLGLSSGMDLMAELLSAVLELEDGEEIVIDFLARKDA